MKTSFVPEIIIVLAVVGLAILLVKTTVNIMPDYDSQEISATEYDVLNWYLRDDCAHFPLQCKTLKTIVKDSLKDGKITNAEYMKYIEFVLKLETNPNAKSNLNNFINK